MACLTVRKVPVRLVENLEAILAVPGVDMAQFGPVDYAMSIGVTDDRAHPAVREARDHMIATALKLGVTPRAEIEQPGMAQPYLEQGVRHFCMGTDVRILYHWYRDHGAALREIFDGK